MHGPRCHLVTRATALLLTVVVAVLTCVSFRATIFLVGLRLGGSAAHKNAVTTGSTTQSSSSSLYSASLIYVGGSVGYDMFQCLSTTFGNNFELPTQQTTSQCDGKGTRRAAGAFAILGVIACFIAMLLLVMLVVVEVSWNCQRKLWANAERLAAIVCVAAHAVAFSCFFVCLCIFLSFVDDFSGELSRLFGAPFAEEGSRWGFTDGAGSSTLTFPNASRVITVTSYEASDALWLMIVVVILSAAGTILVSIPAIFGVNLCHTAPLPPTGEAVAEGNRTSARAAPSSVTSDDNSFNTSEPASDISSSDAEDEYVGSQADTRRRRALRSLRSITMGSLVEVFSAAGKKMFTLDVPDAVVSSNGRQDSMFDLRGLGNATRGNEEETVPSSALAATTASAAVASAASDGDDCRSSAVAKTCSGDTVSTTSSEDVFCVTRTVRSSGEVIAGLVTFVNTSDQSTDLPHHARTTKSRRKHLRRAAEDSDADAVMGMDDCPATVPPDGAEDEQRRRRQRRRHRKCRSPPRELSSQELHIVRDLPLPHARRSSLSSTSTPSDVETIGSEGER